MLTDDVKLKLKKSIMENIIKLQNADKAQPTEDDDESPIAPGGEEEIENTKVIQDGSCKKKKG
jgi:hypothetical protein